MIFFLSKQHFKTPNFYFHIHFQPLTSKLATKTRKTTYQSRYDKVNYQTEKETTTSKETTFSASYRQLVSLRKRGAYSKTCSNPVK